MHQGITIHGASASTLQGERKLKVSHRLRTTACCSTGRRDYGFSRRGASQGATDIDCSWESIWGKITQRCRQQTRRAGKRRRKAGPAASDRALVEGTQQAPKDVEGAKNAALRLIKLQGEVGTCANGGSASPRRRDGDTHQLQHRGGAQRTGAYRRAVCGQYGRTPEYGGVPSLVRRIVFLERMPTLRGTCSDGDDWVLQKELTFELFLDVLRRMPKRKGVGSSGWSVELLLEADLNLQRMFYDAIGGPAHRQPR
jgi:hypothetical protein